MLRSVFVFVLMMWLAFAPAIFIPVVSAAPEVNSPEFLAVQGISESTSLELPVSPPAGQEDNAGLGSSMQSPETLFAQMGQPPQPHTIYLKSREFVPGIADAPALDLLASPDAGRVHLLVQLDFIPRQVAKDALAAQGLVLLSYVPDYAWIASYSSSGTRAVLELPGVTWAGALLPEDKLDSAIQAGLWSEFNLAPDGTAAVYVVFHKDESLEKGRDLVGGYGGRVTGAASGINLLMVEMPVALVQSLAWEDSVQWIEPAAPPLREANDGVRPQIGADTVNAIPYSLDGGGIDVLVFDGGQVGDHPDTTGRLTHGDAASVSDHSTHVAGTLGGNGSQSAGAGGTANQWRGIAPGVDIVSYGVNLTYDYIFYNDVGDIEADWAAAQNTHGADLGSASLGMNIYANYPTRCDLMGNYGATEVLMDQIVRGGNSTVGLGDRYIAIWAAGNERGATCGTYGTTAPPAGAKNPIQVGASNTNDNSMTTFSSWGPTDDGRLKPVVVAGGEQIGGDGGIKSTVPNLFINRTTRNCDGSGDDYCYPYDVMQGTSMATPAVAGGIALMLQHYRDVYNTSSNFYPSTAKAILIHTADDMGNAGPDYQWGYGQVDLPHAIDLISRRALRQDSVTAGAVDVFSLIVPSNSAPLVVSLAWDDFEATFNANPTLINNLDLELVAPSGAIWRPWVLNPASPASNATRGVDNRNNQEQVHVPTPEVGTWIVRVSGATVPQSPQAYSLVCEGCKPVNLGVCQSQVGGVASLEAVAGVGTDASAQAEEVAPSEATAMAWTPLTPQTEGELWQKFLEAPVGEMDVAASLEVARQAGPQAVLEAGESLTGEGRDLAEEELRQARQLLAEQASPPPETPLVSEAEETALVQSQAALDVEMRTQALMQPASLEEDVAPTMEMPQTPAAPDAPAADLAVGSGCTYATITAAMAAANPGDRLLLEGGVTFIENLSITKSLTIHGGYNGCASGSTARTIISGGGIGRVMYIYENLDITLENLNITNANTSGNGAGIFVRWNTHLSGNNLEINNNTSSALGGGVRLWGGSATFTNSYIHNNTALEGAGVYAEYYNGFSAALDLASSADLYDNSALAGNGYGGGVFMRQGTVNITDCSDLYSNDAILGGGAYLITSTLTLTGDCSEIDGNTATGDGGGFYAIGSTIELDDQAELYNNGAGTDGTGSGGGAYLNNSTLNSAKSLVWYNTAASFGGGVHAGNGSIVDFDLGSYVCLGARCSRISNNTVTNNYGGGVYANSSDISLENTFVENNTADYGGGLYAFGADSQVTLFGNVFARNNASGGVGDGLRIFTGVSLSGSGNTLAYNESGGAATGRAIDMSGGSLSLDCSVIWGHASSINAGVVSYSAVQGGYTGTGNINLNPLFMAPASQDYHLQTTSPAIDRCLSASTWDYDGELRPIVRTSAASPYDMGADEVSGAARVGVNGACAYGTIQQAVDSATDGSTVRVSGGVYFENVDITGKSLTIRGGYDATCSNPVGAATRVEGSLGTGSVFDIYGGTPTLENLVIAWGNGTGAGLDVDGNARVTLSSTDLTFNHGVYGGGVWINAGSVVTATNGSNLTLNTASSDGGGGRVWGRYYAAGGNEDITANCAANGGGFSVSGGELNLNDADLYANTAANANGTGGAVQVSSGGSVTFTSLVFVGSSGSQGNTAYDGGGIYADASTIHLNDSGVTFYNNQAAHSGGGLYLANGSALHGLNPRIGSEEVATGGNDAVFGAGIYALNSSIDFAGRFYNNIAANSGGALYADHSDLRLTNAQVGGSTTNQPNQLGASGSYGAGLYLANNSTADLGSTQILNNLFNTTSIAHGGGVYLINSSAITMTSSTVLGHLAPSASTGRGAGLYADNSRVTLDASQVFSNTAGMNGGGLRLWGSSTLDVRNNSELSHNRSNNGDGGGVAATGAATIRVQNATLQDNRAATNGGAVSTDAGTLNFTGWFDVRYNHANGNGGAVAISGSADPNFNASGATSYLAANTAGGNGGALYLANNLSLELYATSGVALNLSANSASGDGGVGYANAGGFFDYFGNLLASSNTAGGNGGVFYLSNASRLWVDDYFTTRPQFWANSADNGGVVYASGSPQVECDGADLGWVGNGNHATSGSGGAVYLDGSILVASNCTIVNNWAAEHGGGLAAVNGSNATIDAEFASTLASTTDGARLNPQAPQAAGCNPAVKECSSFYNNHADMDANGSGDGGAIYNSASTLNLNHTYLYDNQAQRGGAIYQTEVAASSVVYNSLLYNNTSLQSFGAGVRTQQGSLDLRHSTIADNLGGAGVSLGSATCQARNNIAWGNEFGGFSIAPTLVECSIDQSGYGGAAVNPLFVGGGDYHLQAASPAVNACANGLTPDLENVVRPSGALFDMGAFEYLVNRLYAPVIMKP